MAPSIPRWSQNRARHSASVGICCRFRAPCSTPVRPRLSCNHIRGIHDPKAACVALAEVEADPIQLGHGGSTCPVGSDTAPVDGHVSALRRGKPWPVGGPLPASALVTSSERPSRFPPPLKLMVDTSSDRRGPRNDPRLTNAQERSIENREL